jgi:hypothetical protein
MELVLRLLLELHTEELWLYGYESYDATHIAESVMITYG